MFGLTFLSNEKTKRLQQHRDRLAAARTPLARNEILLEIQNIEVQAMPYQKCNLAEADELRSQLLSKINTLYGIGKGGGAEVFRMHLRDVEFHISTLQMQEHLAEQAKMPQPDQAPNAADRSPTVSSEKREKKRQEALGHHRWSVGFEDEPDLTNK